MNTVLLSGRLAHNAQVNGGEKNIVSFTLAAQSGYDKENESRYVEFIPCVLFKASPKLAEILVDGKGKFVEFTGRINIADYTRGDKTVTKTQVVVDNRSFNIVSTKPAE